MKLDLKNWFKKPTNEDKGNFYCFERIWGIAPRHYVINNCSEGFIALVQKSSIPCERFVNSKVETQGRGFYEIEYSSENLAALLAKAMRGEL